MKSLIEGRQAIPLLLRDEYLLLLEIEAEKKNLYRGLKEEKVTSSHLATAIVEEYFAYGRRAWLENINKKAKSEGGENENTKS